MAVCFLRLALLAFWAVLTPPPFCLLPRVPRCKWTSLLIIFQNKQESYFNLFLVTYPLTSCPSFYGPSSTFFLVSRQPEAGQLDVNQFRAMISLSFDRLPKDLPPRHFFQDPFLLPKDEIFSIPSQTGHLAPITHPTPQSPVRSRHNLHSLSFSRPFFFFERLFCGFFLTIPFLAGWMSAFHLIFVFFFR